MRRWLLVGGAAATVQMVVFVVVAGALRPGYDSSRNWISQLSLGPGGGLATLNLALCGLWVVLGGFGLRHRLGPGWTVRLVLWCGAGLIAVAVVPTDPGIGYPPDVAEAHTGIGLVHQIIALALGLAGIGASALLGRDVRAARFGYLVAAIVAASFVVGTVLVLLDAGGVTPGAPSGLFERIALFTGLAWIGGISLALLRPDGADSDDGVDGADGPDGGASPRRAAAEPSGQRASIGFFRARRAGHRLHGRVLERPAHPPRPVRR